LKHLRRPILKKFTLPGPKAFDLSSSRHPSAFWLRTAALSALNAVRMHQTEPDASGRRAVKPLPGSEFIIPCSYVIAAIGQKMDPTVFIPEDGIALTRWGTIETKENFTTSREGVFAGGDAATGPKTLILRWRRVRRQQSRLTNISKPENLRSFREHGSHKSL